jgi:large repetitive protein
MPKEINNVETNANKIFDMPVRLEAGQVNSLSFPQDSISEMRLTPTQELEISFRDGSKVVIENFQELVNSAQSCGRDTIIQLSDNTIIYPEELNAKLAQAGSVNFAGGDTSGDAGEAGVMTISQPRAGQIVERDIRAGEEYKLGFNLDQTVSAAQAGQNLILTFKDGGVLVLKNYFSATGSDTPATMTAADGSGVDANTIMTACKLVQMPSVAELVTDGAPQQVSAREKVAMIEPAAGEEPAAEKVVRKSTGTAKKQNVADIEPAAGDEAPVNVANIEPAAGDAGAQLNIGGRGSGFSSALQDVSLQGANAIGPIGPTALSYGIPSIGGSPVLSGTNPPPNSIPTIQGASVGLDETNQTTIGGSVSANFGTDAPGTFALSLNNFSATGSILNNFLTSGGVPVVLSQLGNQITGTANGQTVFTLTMNPTTGAFTFVQSRPLDHADGSNPNDVINMNFTVIGRDSNGDTASTTVTVQVRDDAPIAVNDAAAVPANQLTVSGNVITNDNQGQDIAGKITQISFNGQTVSIPTTGSIDIQGAYGTLTINANGQYSYLSKNTTLGTDVFTYTLRDFDGDTSQATLSLTVQDLDVRPIIIREVTTIDESNLAPTQVFEGQLDINFGVDGPGTVVFNPTFESNGSRLNNALTSNGVPVTVSLTGNTYTGTANGVTVFTMTINPQNGRYTFTQFEQLDHADPNAINDSIDLVFGITATDADGDTTTDTVTIRVLDDNPQAVNDTATIPDGNNTATGNVFDNDIRSQDGTNRVQKVTFNGVDTVVPTSGTVNVVGAHGTLTIAANGQFTYVSNGTGGQDVFRYTIIDFDGDTSQANLTINSPVADEDTVPAITPSVSQVDETNMAPGVSINGTVVVDPRADGPATVTFNNNFTSGGSQLGGALTSGGVAVVTSLVGNTYTGTANGQTVFTMTINPQTGAYTYNQVRPFDHADASNPNDVINLTFGVTATDTDGDTATSTITINVLDDVPVAVADTNSVPANQNSTSGNVITNDSSGRDGGATVTKVTFGGVDYPVPSTGTVQIIGTHGTLVIGANGAYTYTKNANAQGVDTFGYTIRDTDGDTSSSTLAITVTPTDATPNIGDAVSSVDETTSGNLVATGTVPKNFFTDGPGTIVPTGTVTPGGSLAGGALTSAGVAVVTSLVGNTYTGTANGQTVYTLVVNTDGSYTYTQVRPFDHGNATDPNDVITLRFNVTGTDSDGDTDTGTITINIADDVPVAVNDTNSVAANQSSTNGNVLTNDASGRDGGALVTKVTFNGVDTVVPLSGTVQIIGTHGTLVIGANGAYTYTKNANAQGVDTFNYTIRDFDGDTSSANLVINVARQDDVPQIGDAVSTVDETTIGNLVATGTVPKNFFTDGPGAIVPTGTVTPGGSLAGGALTSAGVAVVTSLVGNTYTGTANGQTVYTLVVNTDGSYTYTQVRPFDHGNATDPNDVITLRFNVTGTDSDGDTDTGTITINIVDDAPVAVNDAANMNEGGTATGNVMLNDTVGDDVAGTVTQVVFGGQTFQVPTNGSNVQIVGQFGTLTINNTGAYSYQALPNVTQSGTDAFRYTIRDFDGDTSQANLSVNVNNVDREPTITPVVRSVDETDLFNAGTQTLTGTIAVNYNGDGPGTMTPQGASSFQATGSLLGGALTSNGQAVTVAVSGNTYTGTAGGRTIFTLQINADGSYTYRQLDQLDHADGSNANDVITLRFGVTATDADGDAMSSSVTINVLDDVPLAVNDSASIPAGQTSSTGNVLSNDRTGADEGIIVTKVTFNGVDYTVPATGTVNVPGAHGTLTIAATGAFTYTSNNASTGTDNFVYTIRDRDGDTSQATLAAGVNDIDDVPQIGDAVSTVDETTIGNLVATGTVPKNFFTDGPGTIVPTGTVTVGGSAAGGALTSAGVAVVTSLVGNTYTGTANGQTVYTLVVNTDGSYTYTQVRPFDHGNATDPNDVITLRFNVTGTDSDGDTDTGTITINIVDDAPVAVNDAANMNEGGTATGNVMLNDTVGDDVAGTVTQVVFGGQTFQVPTNGSNVQIVGQFGTLTINNTGAYSYQANNVNASGRDSFTYTIRDFDGDRATATLNIDVNDRDTTPSITPSSSQVDESNMAPTTSTTGAVTANWQDDGPGSYSLNNSFTSGGSRLNGQLTSNGVPVTVALVNGSYVGTANGQTVFTLTLNAQTGSYTYTQVRPFDHADAANPNDVITLDFGVTATDADGDTATTAITIRVLDDQPLAVADVSNVNENGNVTGNVLTNDSMGQDVGGRLTQVTFGGQTFQIPAGGQNVQIVGQYGTLTINSTGAYSYQANNVNSNVSDVFNYTMVDRDGDPSTSTLTVNVANTIDPPLPPTITAPHTCVVEDCLPNDASNRLNLNVTRNGGDGDEVITVTVSGFRPGWQVLTSESGGTYNAATGVWTITLAAGQSLTTGPRVIPPHNSDADLTLSISASVFDPDSGQTATATGSATVIVDALADVALVDAQELHVSTNNVARLNISAAVTDLDGSEVIREVWIYGVNPSQGFTLSAGTYHAASGAWIVNYADLANLNVIAPVGSRATLNLAVLAVSEEVNFSGQEFSTQNNYNYSDYDYFQVMFGQSSGSNVNVNVNTTINVTTTATVGTADIIHVQDDTRVTVTGFNAAEGDRLNLSDVLHINDPVSQAITNFVYARVENGNTIISVNETGVGGAAAAHDVAVLNGVANTNVSQLVTLDNNHNGNI